MDGYQHGRHVVAVSNGRHAVGDTDWFVTRPEAEQVGKVGIDRLALA